MAARAEEHDRPAPVRPGDLREVIREAEHGRDAGGVVGAGFEPAVAMREDVYRFVGRAGQRAPHGAGLAVGLHLHVEPHVQARRLFADQVAHRIAVVHAERKRRDCRAGRIELRADVARQADRDDDGGRALVLRAADGAFGGRRVTPRSRQRHAEEDDRLALDVAADVVRLAAGAEIRGFEIKAVAGRARRAVRGLRRVQPHGLAAAGRGDGPRLRHPLRREIEGLHVNVGQADRLEPLGQPLTIFLVRRRSNHAAPELRMPLIAISPRDGGLIHDPLMEVFPSMAP